MSGVEIFQIWLMAFVTLALFSFMYKDNPIYKVAEHIFAGLTAGYQVGLVWDTVVLQQLWNPMLGGKWWLFVPGILGLLMFARFWQKWSWVSRVSLAFVMGVTSGIFITSQLHGLVLPQMQDTMVGISEKVGESEDPFGSNINGLLITDGEASDDVALAYDDTASVAVIAEPSVAETGYPQVLAGSTSSTGESVNRNGDASVLLQAEFADTAVLGFGEFYTIEFEIRESGEAQARSIAQSTVWSSGGISLTETGSGTFLAEYNYDPGDAQEVGSYDLQFTVERRSIMFLLTAIVIIGVIATLIYFYFSKPHTGALGVTAKVGIWFIMISFGAHFGYTVMGRVSLLIGRVQFLVEEWIASFSHIF
ncbi:MAG: hypothetical protein DRP45_05350 [Candidatus Zixiibacteriota bacterium]|nr:MAG: hypothetical protein DRP45_05350 [candidate division Zixibacteria bacterium]